MFTSAGRLHGGALLRLQAYLPSCQFVDRINDGRSAIVLAGTGHFAKVTAFAWADFGLGVVARM